MAGALHKTMAFFGLADEDRYDEHDVAGEEWFDMEDGAEGAMERHADVTPITRDRPFARLVEPAAPAAAAELRRITTIHPRTYNEAKNIGESFRAGIPVIMNLTEMSDADAKRLVDFSAGLVFGLRGSIERITNKVFLLSPAHVEVTGEAPVPVAATVFNQS